MTNKKAIYILNQCKSEVDEAYDNRDVMPCPQEVLDCGEALGIAINAIKVQTILQNNLSHTQPEVYGGWYNGNILLGMTNEDYEEIVSLIGVDNDN